MQSEIVLDSGPRIAIQGRPAQGTKHEVVFGTLQGTGERVVVKFGGSAGALARERVALEYLTGRGVPVPELRATGLAYVSGECVACLVMRRHDGEAPVSRDGWRRMGRALGRLAAPVGHVGHLPLLDRQHFGDEHAQRIRELGGCLEAVAAAVPDWPSLASTEIPVPGPLVLTHGDPGPGNFLDDAHTGWLIDWEDAHVAPLGLDLGRVAFIAWLGSGPAGFVGRDQEARALAAVAGYLESVPGGWQPSIGEMRWWFAVAGVQFIHRRRQLRGWPAPWEEAVEILRRGLRSQLLRTLPSHASAARRRPQ